MGSVRAELLPPTMHNHPPRRFLSSLLSLAVLAAACGPGAQGPAGPEGPAGPSGMNGTNGMNGRDVMLDPSLAPIDKAYAAIGGRAAVEGLNGIKLTVKGTRSVLQENFSPEAEPHVTNVFTQTIGIDLAGDGLRIDNQRTVTTIGFPAMQTFSEILAGNVGATNGMDSLFGLPPGPILSDRWASIRRQQQLLNPHLLLKDVAAGKRTATALGTTLFDGSAHQLVSISDPVRPIILYVHAATGRIDKLETVENDALLSDVELEVVYSGWRAATGGALLVPTDVFLTLDGTLIHSESERSAELNPTFAATTFQLPAGAAPVHNAALAARGNRNHQHHQMWAGAGIPIDGLITAVTPNQLSPGVFHLTAGFHNSLVVEQANGLVLFDAPLYPEVAEAIITWAATQFPNKPFTHVVLSHFHRDHTAGVRALVARGAKVVVGEVSRGLFTDVLRRSRTVEPDALQTTFKPAVIETIAPGGSLTLADTTRPVQVYAIRSIHAADMLLPYLPNQQTVFTVDIYNPGLGVNIQALDLHAAIRTSPMLNVTTIAGGHGGTTTLTAFEAELRTAGLIP